METDFQIHHRLVQCTTGTQRNHRSTRWFNKAASHLQLIHHRRTFAREQELLQRICFPKHGLDEEDTGYSSCCWMIIYTHRTHYLCFKYSKVCPLKPKIGLKIWSSEHFRQKDLFPENRTAAQRSQSDANVHARRWDVSSNQMWQTEIHALQTKMNWSRIALRSFRVLKSWFDS